MGTLLALTVLWISQLGGLALAPDAAGAGNATGRLFNWHPLLMVLSFGVLMPEAILSYRAPLVTSTRPTRKKVHWGLHSAAVVCTVAGVYAAFLSHSLKLPDPIPNMYSAHSAIGLFTLLLMAFQFCVGGLAYLWPTVSLSQRMALGPVHRFLGTSVWTLGLGSIVAGVQEKTTFVQTGGSLSGAALYGPLLRIPQLMLVCVAMLLLFVLYHFVPSASHPEKERESLLPQALGGDDGGGGACSRSTSLERV